MGLFYVADECLLRFVRHPATGHMAVHTNPTLAHVSVQLVQLVERLLAGKVGVHEVRFVNVSLSGSSLVNMNQMIVTDRGGCDDDSDRWWWL